MDKQLFYEGLCETEDDLLKKIEEATLLIKDLNERLKATRVLKPEAYLNSLAEKKISPALFTVDSENSIKPQNKIKRTYKKRAKVTVEDKVFKALKALSNGTAKEVATKLKEINPKYSVEKAEADAKHYLSKLKTKGKILGHQIEGSLALNYEYLGS